MERCPYCFKPLHDGEACDCHYEESKNARIEEALRPGTVVGACYLIGAVLGQGGFGITYRGYDLDMQKVVAVKEFFPEGMVTRSGAPGGQVPDSGSQKTVKVINTKNQNVFRKSQELFYREAVALGKLSTLPNVVHAYRIFQENNTAYIIMDFVEGRSLKAVLRERGRLPEKETLEILLPVLSVLEKVHRQGVLHRDIAPDNIMITKDGQPVLLDFGAARVEEGHKSSLIIGKKGFSSPEQMSGEEQDERADIYALGATFYNVLTGKVPQDSVSRALKDRLIPPAKLVPGISREISDAVMKAMEPLPENRWRSAKEFRTAVSRQTDPQEVLYGRAIGSMDLNTRAGYEEALRLFGQIPGVKDADLLAGRCREMLRNLESEEIYGYANQLMKSGTLNDCEEALKQFSRIPGYKDAGTLAEICRKQIEALRSEPPVISKPVRKPIPAGRMILRVLAAVMMIGAGIFGYGLYRESTVRHSLTPKPTATPRVLQIGDLITCGRYEQDNDLSNGAEAIEWQVLAVENGRALVISRYGLDAVQYNEKLESVTWKSCTLRSWLNGEFFRSAFSADEQSNIAETLIRNPDNPKYGTAGGNDTRDRIFLLSIDEAEKYFANDDARQCRTTAYAKSKGAYVNGSNGNSWWLRSPGSIDNNAAYVSPYGVVINNGIWVINSFGVVRPAFWLNL